MPLAVGDVDRVADLARGAGGAELTEAIVAPAPTHALRGHFAQALSFLHGKAKPAVALRADALQPSG